MTEELLLVPALSELTKRLMQDLKANAERKTITTKDGDTIAYDESFVSKSKPIGDEFDCLLAKHYGFTDEELDFIPSTGLRAGINYDLKYRRGEKSFSATC